MLSPSTVSIKKEILHLGSFKRLKAFYPLRPLKGGHTLLFKGFLIIVKIDGF